MDAGGIKVDGSAGRVIEEYLGHGGGAAERTWANIEDAPGDELVKLRAVRVVDEHGALAPEIDIRKSLAIEVEYWNLSSDPDFRPFANVHLFNAEGTCLFVSLDATNLDWRNRPRRRGLVRARCQVPGNFLAEGSLFVSSAVTSVDPATVHVHVEDVVAFHVLDPSDGDGSRSHWAGDIPGVIRPMLVWNVREIEDSDQAQTG
jgi:lipopolysaccharide transport system ATP-binding protein